MLFPACGVVHFRPCTVLEDEDNDDDEKRDTAVQPELKSGAVFAVLDNPENTWDNVWQEVESALVRDGHHCATVVKRGNKVRKFKFK